MEIRSSDFCKVWKSGSALVITVPKSLIEAKNIESGDTIFVEWKELTKKKKKGGLPEL